MMSDFVKLRTLQSEAEYQAALKAARPYFDTEPAADTSEAERFDALVRLIEEYEDRQYRVLQKATVPEGRIARKVEDLDDETLRAIATSAVPSEFGHLDELIKDWKP